MVSPDDLEDLTEARKPEPGAARSARSGPPEGDPDGGDAVAPGPDPATDDGPGSAYVPL